MPENEEKKDSSIDISKILLPKKDPSADSAQRINAGALLAQENKAGAEGLPKQGVPEKNPLTPSGSTPDGAPPPGIFSETPAAAPKAPESSIKQLQTYRGDIESVVQNKNISTVSIAAAEADKPKSVPLPEFKESSTAPLFTKTLMVVGGVIMLALAAGVVAYVVLTPHTVPVTPNGSVTPFITVDNTSGVSFAANPTRNEAMGALETARKDTKLSLGLIDRLYVTEPTGDKNNPTKEVSASELLQKIAPFVPSELLRTLQPTYLLGIHSFDENSAFMIVRTDSYETAYAGMLAWETNMQQDLTPFFSRTPPVHPGVSSSPLATSSNNSTATSTASSTPVASSQTLNPAFVDRIVQNKDARVIQTPEGDILLMWTFLDRNTLVITTNEYTLKEIISRITTAPTTGLPQ